MEPRGDLVGSTTPRTFTAPLRNLTGKTTEGFAFEEFCAEIGRPLTPWQAWLGRALLELNPDGTLRFRTALVLIARQQGKTEVAALLALYFLYRRRSRLVVGTAQTLDIARECWLRAGDVIEDAQHLEMPTIRRANGQEAFRFSDGRRYLIKSANRRTRGLSPDLLIVDELREQRTFEAWQAMTSMILAREEGMVLAFSNAGDDSSVVLMDLLDRGRATANDPHYTGDLFIAEWSAPSGAALDDRDGWRQAMPSLGFTVTERSVAALLASSTPASFRTEALCQHVASMADVVVEASAWNACADPALSFDGLRDRVVLGLDVSAELTSASLVAVAVTDAGTARIALQRYWQGPTTTVQVRKELPDLIARIGAARLAWLPKGPAGALAAFLRKLPASREVNATEAVAAVQALADEIRGRLIQHADDPTLSLHVMAARRRSSADGTVRVQRAEGSAIDGLMATAAALHVARSDKAPSFQLF